MKQVSETKKDNSEALQIIPRLLNVKKAALYSGIPIWGVRQLIGMEKLPHLKIGNKFYIAKDDIDNWIQETKRGGAQHE